MRSLIRFGLSQSVLMNLVFIATVVFAAAWALPRLPVDRYPNFSFGEQTITVQWPGASAADVERLVAKEIEDAIRGMDDLEFVKSTAIAGQAEIQVKFLDDTDYAALYDELRLRVLSAQNRLPVANGEPLAPIFAKVETDQWLPVIQVNLTSADPAKPLGKRQLTILAKELQTRFELVEGVKRVELWGDEPQQVDVALDPAALRRHGVTPEDVRTALTGSGTSVPAGSVATSDGDRLVRIDGRWRDPDQVLATVVRLDGDGRAVFVRDLVDQSATGIRGPDRGTRITIDGKDTVACKVVKDAAADARSVKERILAEVEAFKAARPDGGYAIVYALDSTGPIEDSISVLGSNLIQGFALVLLILTFTLGLRASALALSGMVFAFLGTLLWFQLSGASINELSLLGFVIVVGILVDDAVVVLDNIARHREEGKPLDRALLDGTSEVFWPVVASVATTMASFLPLLLMTGAVGQFFALVPTAVVAALFLSLVESLLMLPAHVRDAERIFGPARIRARTGEDAALGYLNQRSLIGSTARVHDRALRWCLGRPWTTVGLTFALFVLAIGVLVQSAFAPFIGMRALLKLEFFPSDASVAEVRVTMPPGTPIETTDAKVREISRFIAGHGPGAVASAQGIAGLTIDTTYKPQWGSQYGIVQVEIAPRAQRTIEDPNQWIRDLGPEIQNRFATGASLITVEAQAGGPPTGLPINVRIAGLDDAAVRRCAEDLFAWMQSAARPGEPLHGAIGLATDLGRTDAVIDIDFDQERLARYGLRESDAAAMAAGLVDGAFVGNLRRSDDEIPVKVRLAKDALGDLSTVGDVPLVHLADGTALTLADLGRLELRREPSELVRRDFVRTLTITGRLAPDSPINAFQATAIIRDWMADNQHRHPGVVVAFGGEAESTGRTYASLGFAFLVSVFVIYTILAMQFRSYLQPLLIMSSIIFSLTGVILVMGVFGFVVNYIGHGWVRPERALFTVNAFIAVVALTGMVVNNAIILIDFINTRRAKQPDLLRVLRESGHLRLRAVLLTTITTIAGFLPTAIGIPEFSLTWSPMATAFVAGLCLATILTLLVVPVLYLLLHRIAHGHGDEAPEVEAETGA
jgi:multidrug efflux pump subunit AcrB